MMEQIKWEKRNPKSLITINYWTRTHHRVTVCCEFGDFSPDSNYLANKMAYCTEWRCLDMVFEHTIVRLCACDKLFIRGPKKANKQRFDSINITRTGALIRTVQIFIDYFRIENASAFFTLTNWCPDLWNHTHWQMSANAPFYRLWQM